MRRNTWSSVGCVSLCALSFVACSDGRDGSVADKPLVSGLQISQVAVYQGLKSPVMQDGAVAQSTVPIVVGKDGLLRIFVTPDANWSQHVILAHVELTQGGQALPALEATQAIATASTDDDLTSTINFDLPAATITADLTFSVGLYEMTPGPQRDVAGARYPATGEASLGASVTGAIKVKVIPVAYAADGSNRVPSTNDAMMGAFRDRMKALYPVSDVEITIGDPYTWSSPIGADGTGWDELLNAMVEKRYRDGAAPDVYYYGLFAPAATFNSYCADGCVLGLSPLAGDPMDDLSRASIGVGYPGEDADSYDTFVHEVGHAHGRQHAPCDVQDPDRNYPYTDAEIGVWGYDAAQKTLLPPMGDSRDVMSYCYPTWISDYTYKALYDRVQLVNGTQLERLEIPSRWQSLIVGADSVKKGSLITMRHPPMGTDKTIERVVGGRAERFTARYYPFDHLPGGLLFVREGEDLTQLRIDGLRVR